MNVGAGERDYFSKLLGIPPERMKDLPRGHFATDIRWEGTSIERVPKAQLPYRTMSDAEQRAHQERINVLYGYVPPPISPIQPTTPKPPEGGLTIKEETKAIVPQLTKTLPEKSDPSAPAPWRKV